MSWATSEAVAVLTFLLPGFVGAAVFYALASYPKPGEFGQVVQALVFTTVGQAVAWGLRWALSLRWPGYEWPAGLELMVSVGSAVGVALVVAAAANHDIAHRLLRRIRITRKSSYPSIWYSAFVENEGRYVVLYLENGRRLYGWPEKWPSYADAGHIVMTECEWLINDERLRLCDGSIVVIMADDVEMVEFYDRSASEAERANHDHGSEPVAEQTARPD